MKDSVLTDNLIYMLKNNAWTCEKYTGKGCNDKCRGGVPITIKRITDYKCIGGAFIFKYISGDDWQQVMMLIEKELSL